MSAIQISETFSNIEKNKFFEETNIKMLVALCIRPQSYYQMTFFIAEEKAKWARVFVHGKSLHTSDTSLGSLAYRIYPICCHATQGTKVTKTLAIVATILADSKVVKYAFMVNQPNLNCRSPNIRERYQIQTWEPTSILNLTRSR